jgi:hypothetical protein
VVVVLKNSFSCEVEMFCCQALSHVFTGLLRRPHINKKQWEPDYVVLSLPKAQGT